MLRAARLPRRARAAGGAPRTARSRSTQRAAVRRRLDRVTWATSCAARSSRAHAARARPLPCAAFALRTPLRLVIRARGGPRAAWSRSRAPRSCAGRSRADAARPRARGRQPPTRRADARRCVEEIRDAYLERVSPRAGIHPRRRHLPGQPVAPAGAVHARGRVSMPARCMRVCARANPAPFAALAHVRAMSHAELLAGAAGADSRASASRRGRSPARVRAAPTGERSARLAGARSPIPRNAPST